MRIGEIKKELESYGISTKSFLEKSELVDALHAARAEGKTPTTSGTAPGNTSSSSSNTSSSTSTNREEKIAAEMKKCQALKVGELKKELTSLGISTKTFFEKSEFVRALAEARVDGVNKNSSSNSSSSSEEGYAEYSNVEVLPADHPGPRKKQSAEEQQQQQQGNPFGGGAGGNPFGGAGGNPFGGAGGNPFGGAGGNPFGGGGGRSPFG